ncbi:unnamed protein product [Leptidea sinapis]|uniref:Cytosolic fatty-acid binding proteins domain-containing protein n=1 Tax=Leptidea sinapis TaxID=189913 RepID=A0A5E4QFN1_9NEOP|nr:unnamed protein product [Leptidea sinapis]
MDAYLGKHYKLKTSENFDDYLKLIGVGLLQRKLVQSLSPVSVLTKNADGSYTLTHITPIRKMATKFRLGEEFEEERADGVKVKSVMTIEGNKLIQIQTESSGRKSTHVREFSRTALKVTTTAEDWDGVCIRTYLLEQ